jgi:hypothetical protein
MIDLAVPTVFGPRSERHVGPRLQPGQYLIERVVVNEEPEVAGQDRAAFVEVQHEVVVHPNRREQEVGVGARCPRTSWSSTPSTPSGAMAPKPPWASWGRQLGLDHFSASRMVAAATQGGYLERCRSETDRRRSVLALTSEGRVLLDSSLRWQQARFIELTDHWDDHDRAAFAHHLVRLAQEVQA